MEQNDTVRVAVEGCGHGTLHAIYASIEEACRFKGWDGVDLVIIGGDFQAVRNQYDLNVTAMPVKYRQMADFHEYYSGVRRAPFLTIFIGGNHEASNHLFELYYGGWVAPNIYYLGAANIIRFGPLRIASLSGIWKGYDYRKPHYERLPYSSDDMHSIFHVRELDARKLLTVRTQVDIGLSHDWPQGIEWHGNTGWLFKKKPDFEDDATLGKLGNVAARQCLDRLRPSYWFSAHLHIKYRALFQHKAYEPVRHPRIASMQVESEKKSTEKHNVSDQEAQKENRNKVPPTHKIPENSHEAEQSSRDQPNVTAGQNFQVNSYNAEQSSSDRPRISAWQNFQVVASKAEQEEDERRAVLNKQRRAERDQHGVGQAPQFAFSETFKQVRLDDGHARQASAVARQNSSDDVPANIPNLDGCASSAEYIPKRKRVDSSPDEAEALVNNVGFMSNNYGGTTNGLEPRSRLIENPDAIEIDLSSDEEDAEADGQTEVGQHMDVSPDMPTEANDMIVSATQNQHTPRQLAPPSATKPDNNNVQQKAPQQEQGDPAETSSPAEEVSEWMRAKLAELSSSFLPTEKIETSPSLPLPEAIGNKTTKFLALAKCVPHHDFLQLLEIPPNSPTTDPNLQRPFKLSYDSEWLAILRVFAPELHLGGQPTDPVTPNRGDTYYRDRIIEEEKWIEENVVKPGKTDVPENFTLTAPVHDPNLEISGKDLPREVTNPQTSAFCALIGIENPFDISEADRDRRIAQGPRPERQRGAHGHVQKGRGYRGRGAGRGAGGSRSTSNDRGARGGARGRGGRGGRRGH